MKTYKVEKRGVLVVSQRPNRRTGEPEPYHEGLRVGTIVSMPAAEAEAFGDKLVPYVPEPAEKPSVVKLGEKAELKNTKASDKSE